MRGTLSNRLEFLMAEGFLHKKQYQNRPPRYEYRLTEKGLSLYPWALMLWQWESEWAPGDNALPTMLVHQGGNAHPLNPQCVCRHCRKPLHFDDVERVKVADVADTSDPKSLPESWGGQRRTRAKVSGDIDTSLAHVVDIIGDRWTTLVLAGSFVGLTRYDDFLNNLGIATNILADRLKILVDMKIFSRREYQVNPSRMEYLLTEKGKSLYPQTMTLRQWVLDVMPPLAHPYKLVHKSCGHDLEIDVVCGVCGKQPQIGKVRFDLD
ncbi:transcriptional regulator [Lacimicrobium alkaliphilum]|uniref:Transcriptional regulator n=2 Tax=Lacimicrobium alkaliphilum TaxID=1526571 RepID=A0ABQ1RB19_9ALTE|nr:transcriptional regulator [Lacimicrobium alkaliphilum]